MSPVAGSKPRRRALCMSFLLLVLGHFEFKIGQAAMEAIRKRRKKVKHSAIREQLRRQDAAALAKLTPTQRLQAALDLSDFCLMLAAKVREADAPRSITKGRRVAR
ncbi:MAG: hypothetical protein ACLQVG_14440 [Terriglobia bacterium]